MLTWASGWSLAAAFYWLLIDTTDTPELITGAVAAALAATGYLLAHEQGLIGGGVRGAWLRRGLRPVARAPLDIAILSRAALGGLVRRDRRLGAFRAVPFAARDPRRENARHALAESLGSFAPNTIVVGIDRERELILAHQLRRRGGRESIDVLGLG